MQLDREIYFARIDLLTGPHKSQILHTCVFVKTPEHLGKMEEPGNTLTTRKKNRNPIFKPLFPSVYSEYSLVKILPHPLPDSFDS